MSRWSEAELAALGLSWERFHQRYPERSFDAWEVKRRRVRKPGEATRLVTAVYQPALPAGTPDVLIDLGGNHRRFGLVSDTHLGSKFEQLSALRSFYAYADEREVEAFIHAGDLYQGSDRMHPGMALEVHVHGAEAQADYADAVYPRSARGVPTYLIGGNHDESFQKDGGADPVRGLCQRREDLVYLGQGLAFLTIGGLRMAVMHPDGGGGATKSRRGQQIAAALPPDVQLALIGHLHYYCAFPANGMFVLQLPCFQAQYAWMARKPLYPDIGGVILDVWYDEAGRVTRVVPEYVAYRARANDWDAAASRQINEAWTAEGLVVA